MIAPVVLFAYRRADHLRATLDALRRNTGASETPLIVFSDAPRNERDAPAVACVRRTLRGLQGFSSVRVVERRENFGLARSILEGVSEVLQDHTDVIVLEDDMVTSPHFLDYMRDGLGRYADHRRVASIHGYQLPIGGVVPETYFLRGADCWGWATWRRAWESFDRDGARLLGRLEAGGLCDTFDLDGAYPYTRMLRDAVAGRVDSWAILWHAWAFLEDMLSLYPGRSLVRNIGNDGSGQHGGRTTGFDVALAQTSVPVSEIPVVQHLEMRARTAQFHRQRAAQSPALARLRRVLSACLRRLATAR